MRHLSVNEWSAIGPSDRLMGLPVKFQWSYDMKLYGYVRSDKQTLLDLKEVSFVASPDELKKMAEFFFSQSLVFSDKSSEYHAHFSDFLGDRKPDFDVIVCNDKYT